MSDYRPTMFIINFVSGATKKFDDDRFKLEVDLDSNSAKVYSRITQEVTLEIPDLKNVCYIHKNVIKRNDNRNKPEEKIDAPFNPALMEDEFNNIAEEE